MNHSLLATIRLKVIDVVNNPSFSYIQLAISFSLITTCRFIAFAANLLSPEATFRLLLTFGKLNLLEKTSLALWKKSVASTGCNSISNDTRDYRSHMWLVYAYLHQGKQLLAYEAIQTQIKYTLENEKPSPPERYYLLYTKGYYLVETEKWHEEIAAVAVQTGDLSIDAQAVNEFIEGNKELVKNNVIGLLERIELLEKKILIAKDLHLLHNNIIIANINPFTNDFPSKRQLDIAAIVLLEMKALWCIATNDLKKAEDHIVEAIHQSTAYPYPPALIRDPGEIYAGILISTGRYEQGLQYYRNDLILSPNRLTSLKGALEASLKLKDNEKAKELKRKIVLIQGIFT